MRYACLILIPLMGSVIGQWLGIGAVTAALIATDHQTINTFEDSRGQVAWGDRFSNIGASYTLLPLVAGFYGYGVLRDVPKAREVGVLGGDSFPSGHSIESWALASLIAHEYGRGSKVVPIVAYGLAGVVSAARFTAQKHYASDIVAGGAMGWFIGKYVYQTHMDHAIHRHGWLRAPQVVPEVEPGSGTYAVALVFRELGPLAAPLMAIYMLTCVGGVTLCRLDCIWSGMWCLSSVWALGLI